MDHPGTWRRCELTTKAGARNQPHGEESQHGEQLGWMHGSPPIAGGDRVGSVEAAASRCFLCPKNAEQGRRLHSPSPLRRLSSTRLGVAGVPGRLSPPSLPLSRRVTQRGHSSPDWQETQRCPDASPATPPPRPRGHAPSPATRPRFWTCCGQFPAAWPAPPPILGAGPGPAAAVASTLHPSPPPGLACRWTERLYRCLGTVARAAAVGVHPFRDCPAPAPGLGEGQPCAAGIGTTLGERPGRAGRGWGLDRRPSPQPWLRAEAPGELALHRRAACPSPNAGAGTAFHPVTQVLRLARDQTFCPTTCQDWGRGWGLDRRPSPQPWLRAEAPGEVGLFTGAQPVPPPMLGQGRRISQ